MHFDNKMNVELRHDFYWSIQLMPLMERKSEKELKTQKKSLFKTEKRLSFKASKSDAAKDDFPLNTFTSLCGVCYYGYSASYLMTLFCIYRKRGYFSLL